ncbi:hypothetical protein HY990_02250 [Candidatus Micrarchaeota archaeon]|nr:hypothetical protein [Candidatus Micrarchaeota archaeon]
MKTQAELLKIFRDCKVQYAKDKTQNTYSVKIMLSNKPQIVTVRVGEKFTELSLADQDGNVLEILRQEEKKGVTFTKVA